MKNSQNGYLKTSNQKNADFAVKKIIEINRKLIDNRKLFSITID